MRSQTRVDHGLPGSGWNVKKVRLWAEERFQVKVSVSLIRRILKRGRRSWKKCRKVLRKADPEKRSAYIELFAGLYEQMTGDKVRLVYVDEAHIHREMQVGYTWATTGQPTWRIFTAPDPTRGVMTISSSHGELTRDGMNHHCLAARQWGAPR